MKKVNKKAPNGKNVGKKKKIKNKKLVNKKPEKKAETLPVVQSGYTGVLRSYNTKDEFGNIETQYYGGNSVDITSADIDNRE